MILRDLLFTLSMYLMSFSSLTCLELAVFLLSTAVAGDVLGEQRKKCCSEGRGTQHQDTNVVAKDIDSLGREKASGQRDTTLWSLPFYGDIDQVENP